MQEMENINKDDQVPTSRAELDVETLNSQCNEQSSPMRAENSTDKSSIAVTTTTSIVNFPHCVPLL